MSSLRLVNLVILIIFVVLIAVTPLSKTNKSIRLKCTSTGTQCKLQSMKMGGGVIRGDTFPKLISLIDNDRNFQLKAKVNGYPTKSSKKAEIIALIDKIAEQNRSFHFSMDRDSPLNGTWELIWTTERETLFFCENGLFGKPVANILQSINLQTGALSNVINFEGNRKFSVLGEISVGNNGKHSKRLDFNFKNAAITIPPLPTVNLPPVGKGWFDTLYVNNLYRLSKDSRGDYLVCKRV